MITRDEFPYLRQLIINDCYACQNLDVTVSAEGEDFKHLILTGKNGSGKTTVLRALERVIQYDRDHGQTAEQEIRRLSMLLKESVHTTEQKVAMKNSLANLMQIKPSFLSDRKNPYAGFNEFKSQTVYRFFSANRQVHVNDVNSVTREDEFVKGLDNNHAAGVFFKQYLVNKKVYQVFDVMEGQEARAKREADFFLQLEQTLGRIFEDPGLTLEFVREQFEFFIKLSDGRRITFNQLSEGFSAFLSVLTELLMRTDLLRKQVKDYTYNPCGFVLIDEPETHLHLELQYQMLPLLTSLFPNLQFIVATHSPAVASSITGATVFDLSTGKSLGDVAAGSAYSELMQGHFGVSNEYSNVADAIMADIRRIAKLPDRTQARRELLALLEEKGRYMSPFFRLEVEAQLISLES